MDIQEDDSPALQGSRDFLVTEDSDQEELSWSALSLDQQIEILLQRMSRREKLGQLFVLNARSLRDGSAGSRNFLAFWESTGPLAAGGYILFSENFVSRDQFLNLNREIQERSALPPFLMVDEEGGSVSRLGRNPSMGVPYLPEMRIMRNWDRARISQTVETMARELAALGIHINTAPVLDLDIQPRGPISNRSLGSDPHLVSDLGLLIMDSQLRAGIVPVIKHFPGLGDSPVDTHERLAVIQVPTDTFFHREAIPFYRAIRSGAPMIMLGHAAYPLLTGNEIPASASPQIIQELLRGAWGFEGVIITDALDMGAVYNPGSPSEHVLAAFQAGADLLLMPPVPSLALESLDQALLEGSIDPRRLEESLTRVLRLKLQYMDSFPGEPWLRQQGYIP